MDCFVGYCFQNFFYINTTSAQYGHLPPISKTIQVRRTRHPGHCWRSKDVFITNVLLWIPSHERTSVGRSTRIYLQQFYANTGCSLENLPGAMDDRDELWERVREICASSATWWWWYPLIYTNSWWTEEKTPITHMRKHKTYKKYYNNTQTWPQTDKMYTLWCDQICTMNSDKKKKKKNKKRKRFIRQKNGNKKKTIKLSEFSCDQWIRDIQRHAHKYKGRHFFIVSLEMETAPKNLVLFLYGLFSLN